MGTSGERRQPAGADRSKAVLCRGGSETNGGAKLDGVAVESREKMCEERWTLGGKESFAGGNTMMVRPTVSLALMEGAATQRLGGSSRDEKG
ncbi:hypothetical protein PIB30_057385 [Stylosanthes scabra]|uniref:Uncharacterized protein n=1 Tax=Stylosanthes scabra TaxID=79078 RepID=A0ABU6SLF1_9FABA|nr:hypothetical protein [Stylosanthes scabra]